MRNDIAKPFSVGGTDLCITGKVIGSSGQWWIQDLALGLLTPRVARAIETFAADDIDVNFSAVYRISADHFLAEQANFSLIATDHRLTNSCIDVAKYLNKT